MVALVATQMHKNQIHVPMLQAPGLHYNWVPGGHVRPVILIPFAKKNESSQASMPHGLNHSYVLVSMRNLISQFSDGRVPLVVQCYY